MPTLFISDLHLSPERPEMLERFRTLLAGPARRVDALYILGDMFEQFWVGCDDPTPPNPEFIRLLSGLSSTGVRLYIQRGNRDLLIDQRFAELTGARLLPDLAVIKLYGNKVMITHGDLLCLRDLKYQLYRRLVMLRLSQALFRRLPCNLRLRIAHGLRPAMQKSAQQKPEYIMDVEQSTIEHLLRTSDVTEIIHGHTHRPGIFNFELDGKPARRVVLGDWYGDGKILVCDGNDRRLLAVGEYLETAH